MLISFPICLVYHTFFIGFKMYFTSSLQPLIFRAFLHFQICDFDSYIAGFIAWQFRRMKKKCSYFFSIAFHCFIVSRQLLLCNIIWRVKSLVILILCLYLLFHQIKPFKLSALLITTGIRVHRTPNQYNQRKAVQAPRPATGAYY